MPEITKTLTSRNSVYGDYSTGILTRAALMHIISSTYMDHHGHQMSQRQTEYFWDICNKLSRLAITPDHVDSWHDIQGYAKLIEQDVSTESRAEIEAKLDMKDVLGGC